MKTVFITLLCLGFAVSLSAQQKFKIINYSLHQTVSNPQVWSIVQDNRGIMYFGVIGGIVGYDGVSWRLIELPRKLGAYSLLKDTEGRIWVGSVGNFGYLAPDENGIMHYISINRLIPSEYSNFDLKVFSIENFRNNISFLSDKYLFIFDRDTINVIEAEEHFYSSVSNDYSLYAIDTKVGFSKVSNGRLYPIPGGKNIRATTMLRLSDNDIVLFSMDKRLYLFNTRDDRFTQIESLSKLTGNYEEKTGGREFFNRHEITTGLITPDNNFVMGTINNGIIYFDLNNTSTNTYIKENGMISDDILSLYMNKQGNIWAGTPQGLNYLYRSAAGNKKYVASQETEDTSASAEPDTKQFTAIIRSCTSTLDDSLIFGGAFSQKVGGVQVLEQSKLYVREFPNHYNRFRFEYSSNYLNQSDSIMYSTFLEGFDKRWSKWANRNIREYTNLPKGNYTLKVRAKLPNEKVSRISKYSFIINPAWHETFLFNISQLLFFGFLLVIAALFDKSGKLSKVSEKIIVYIGIAIMSYVYAALGPLIGEYSGGIGFFKILLYGMLSMLLAPFSSMVNQGLNFVTSDNLLHFSKGSYEGGDESGGHRKDY